MDPPEVPPPLPPRGAKTFINEPEESYSSPQNEAQSTPGPTSDMDTAKEPVSEPIMQTTTDNELVLGGGEGRIHCIASLVHGIVSQFSLNTIHRKTNYRA